MPLALKAALVLVVGTLMDGCGDSTTDGGLPLETVAEISLPGESSRFDYQSIDSTRGLLFIAHLGAGEVIVVDTNTRSVVSRVSDVAEAHGVYAVPQLGRAFASATGTNELVAIDEDSGRIVNRSPTGEYPDGVTTSLGRDASSFRIRPAARSLPSMPRAAPSSARSSWAARWETSSTTVGMVRSSPTPRAGASW